MSKQFVVREDKYGNWEVVDTQADRTVHIAMHKDVADSAAMYFNIDREPLSDEELDAMWAYRKGEGEKHHDS